METFSTCPKCGQRREQEWSECPFCGVIYAKAAAPRPPSPPLQGGAWGGPPPAAAAAVGADTWGVPAPAAAGWGAAQPPPPIGDADLYRPPSAPVGEPLGLRHRTAADAGRGTRLAAQVVDSLVVVPLFLAALLPSLVLGADSEEIEMLVLAGASVVALALLAVNLHLLHSAGKTIGKKVLGIRIVRLDGTRAGLGRILVLRMIGPSLLASIPYAGTLFAFVNYLFIFRDDRRCVHDLMADTKVVVG